MDQRAAQLFSQAEGQILALGALLAHIDESALGLPCREKLGDGTVGALSTFIADNYFRIAESVHKVSSQAPATRSGHRIPPWAAHRRPQHRDAIGHDEPHAADDTYTAPFQLRAILERLTVARRCVQTLADLTDAQLDSVSRSGAMRFADGKRTLERVITGMLTHQASQLDAVRAALAPVTNTEGRSHDEAGPSRPRRMPFHMNEKINLAEKLALLEKPYQPGIVGFVNDYKLQIVKVKGPGRTP